MYFLWHPVNYSLADKYNLTDDFNMVTNIPVCNRIIAQNNKVPLLHLYVTQHLIISIVVLWM